MQIHELNSYSGTPSDSTYLAIDDGSETSKIGADSVGITTAMTQSEAIAATSTSKRVITPAVLGTLIKKMHPVGSMFVTSTNTDPNSSLGFGTWELVDKRFKYAWITSGFTWDSTNTQNGAFAAVLHGNSIEFRFVWANKVALTDDITIIGTLDLASIGLSAVQHNMFGVATCDGQNAIGCLEFTLGQETAVLRSNDWVTRAATIPTGVNSNCQAQFALTVQAHTGMIDSFCNEFVWKRTV